MKTTHRHNQRITLHLSKNMQFSNIQPLLGGGGHYSYTSAHTQKKQVCFFGVFPSYLLYQNRGRGFGYRPEAPHPSYFFSHRVTIKVCVFIVFFSYNHGSPQFCSILFYLKTSQLCMRLIPTYQTMHSIVNCQQLNNFIHI